MKTETVPIGTLHLDPANVRKHGERNHRSIMGSLAKFGQQKPIVVDRKGVILAGNGTLSAAKELGWDTIEIVRSDLLGTEATAFAIADNRTAELAEWDESALAATLQSLQDEDFDLDSIGFSEDEIDELCEGLAPTPDDSEPPEAEIDRAEELQAKWKTELGQLWLIPSETTPGREHRLLCGDSTKAEDLSRLMGGEPIESVVSDPPYGVDFDTDYRRFTDKGKSTGNKHDPIANDDKPFDPEPWLGFKTVVLWGGNCFSMRLPLGSWLVWDKRFANGTAWLSDAEIAWMKGGHGAYIFAETSQGAVRPEKVEHPTQKPLSVMAWSIEKSKAGPVVVDPYLGSGTTMLAAERSNRLCYGIELAPKYVAVILERLATMGLEPRLSVPQKPEKKQ